MQDSHRTPLPRRRPAADSALEAESEDALAACLVAAHHCQLGLSRAEVAAQLSRLAALLPALPPQLPDLAPGLLAALLLLEPPAASARLLELKQLLPAADVGALAVRHPRLLVEDSMVVEGLLERVREAEGVADLNATIRDDPG